MKKIVIFDLDGTLLNTLQDLTHSTNFALKQFNFPQKTMEEVRTFVGNGVSKLIELAIPEGKNNKNFNECLKIFKEHYRQNMYNNTTPYYDIEKILKKLKKQNLKIAVVSNKFDLAVKEICKKYFGNLIDYAYGENEAKGIHKKPAPDSVLQVLKDSGFKTNDAVYIGDSEVDIQTAKNSNIQCISVTWGYKDAQFLIDNGATTIINKPDEILKYL